MKNNKIFIVDDEPFTRRYISALMKREGYSDLVELDSGDALLRKLGMAQSINNTMFIFPDTKADLILLDVIMPGTGGMEVCRKIKEQYPTLPIILMTSMHNENDHLTALDIGADAYEIKPLNQKKLMSLIHKLLETKHREDKLAADYENLKNLHKTLPPFVRKKTDKIGCFNIIKTLGNGSSSIVYLVEKEGGERRSALKILNDKVAADPESIRSFRQEIENIHALEHPAVINLYEHGIHEGYPFYVMEHVEGQDLAAYVNNNGAMPFAFLKKVVYELAEALDYIHHQEIIHRDIKLENILITERGHIRLTDFGLSIEENFNRSNDGIVGTPLYLAPEVISGRGVSHQSDVYAFGVVLYQLLTGEPPFNTKSMSDLIHCHCSVEPQRVERLVPDIPPVWGDFVAACLEKNPNKRPEYLLDYTENFKTLEASAF